MFPGIISHVGNYMALCMIHHPLLFPLGLFPALTVCPVLLKTSVQGLTPKQIVTASSPRPGTFYKKRAVFSWSSGSSSPIVAVVRLSFHGDEVLIVTVTFGSMLLYIGATLVFAVKSEPLVSDGLFSVLIGCTCFLIDCPALPHLHLTSLIRLNLHTWCRFFLLKPCCSKPRPPLH